MDWSPTHSALVTCDVFREELSVLDPHQGKWRTVEFLEMGLHDQPDILRKEIQSTINRIEEDPEVQMILLLYGVCGNGLTGITAQHCNMVIPRAHDCVSVLLGGPEKQTAVLKNHPGTYFYSPGWVRGKRVPGPDREIHLREFYGERYPDDEELVDDLIEADQETFAHHDCAAYVDVTNNKEAQSYCRNCASQLGWKYRRLEGDAGLLKDFLHGRWDAQRFLMVKPGHPIRDLVDGEATGIQG